jgi:hypothetical protein
MQAVLLTVIVMAVLTVWIVPRMPSGQSIVTVGLSQFSPWLSPWHPLPPHRSFVVISVCKGRLTGLDSTLAHVLKYLTANSTQLVTLIDKCGDINASSLGLDFPPIRLPNVGRNDHSFAWALSLFVGATHLHDEDLVWFLKDNLDVRPPGLRKRSFPEVHAEARNHGFGCLATMIPPRTDLHLITQLSTFSLNSYGMYKNPPDGFQAKRRPLGKWWDHLGLAFGRHGSAAVLPVCYGGNFAVRMDMIRAVNSIVWPLLVAGLERGDNQEENHYAERTWAGLFSKPANPAGLTPCPQYGYAGLMCNNSA